MCIAGHGAGCGAASHPSSVAVVGTVLGVGGLACALIEPCGGAVAASVVVGAPTIAFAVNTVFGLLSPDPIETGLCGPEGPGGNLTEDLVLREAQSGYGDQIMGPMGDPRCPPPDWVKMQHVHYVEVVREGHTVRSNYTVHWFHNVRTGEDVGFKFKYKPFPWGEVEP
jgi:hypothetical protein